MARTDFSQGISSLDSRYVNVTGDTMTGALTVNAGFTFPSGVIFGDGDTGFYETSDDALVVRTGGTDIATWNYSANDPLVISKSLNSYLSAFVWNTSAGNAASADFILNVDNTTPTSNYFDIGLNGSTCVTAPFTTPGEAYIYNASKTLNIGAIGASSSLKFYTGGDLSTATSPPLS